MGYVPHKKIEHVCTIYAMMHTEPSSALHVCCMYAYSYHISLNATETILFVSTTQTVATNWGQILNKCGFSWAELDWEILIVVALERKSKYTLVLH